MKYTGNFTKRILGIIMGIILLITCMPVQSVIASSACYGNGFTVTIKIKNLSDGSQVVATNTFSSREVMGSTTDSWDVTLKAGSAYQMEVEYIGPEGNSGYVATVSEISSTATITYLSGINSEKKVSSSAYANFNSETYGKHSINIALDGQVNAGGGVFTGCARNIKVNVIFEGAGAKEGETTAQLIPGTHTLTAATNESGDKYTYEWRKTGSSSILGTEKSYTVNNGTDGEQYVVTIKRKDTRTVDGCTGSSESWINTFNIKAVNFIPPQPVENLVYDGTPKTIFTAGQATEGYNIFYYPAGFNGVFGYSYNEYWGDNTYTNAGSYVVRYYVKNSPYPWDGETIESGSITCVIAKAETTVGPVEYTGETLYDDMELSQVQLSVNNPSVQGTISITDSGKLEAGTHVYNWRYKPSNNNYKEVTGTISLTAQHRWEAATCTKAKVCAGCGATEGEALGHSLKYAMDTENEGSVWESCERGCGHSENAKLAVENSYTYTGQVITPATIEYSEGWRGEVKTASDISYEDNVNVGTAKASVTINGVTISKSFSISRKAPEASEFAFAPPSDSIYNGSARLADITVASDVTGMGNIVDVKYYDGVGVEVEPTETGIYTVKINVAEGSNYAAVEALGDSNWTFEILKADATYTAPTPVSELFYTGSEQELIIGGTTEHGVMKYYVSSEAVEGAHNKNAFTDMIPTGTAAGVYYVYYYVMGDGNHMDSDIQLVEAKIEKAEDYIGTVVGTIPEDEATADKITVERTDTTIEGTLTLDDPDATLVWGENEIAYTFTPLDSENYAVINDKMVVVVRDTLAPIAEIKVEENKWNTFVNEITFGLFFKKTQTVTITASDVNTGSGVDKIYYYLSSVAISEDGIKDVTDWKEYDGEFDINPDKKYIIYVQVIDKAGNITYVSSDGMILDATAPVITGVENGGEYYGNTEFTVTDGYLDTVTLDGEEITLTDGKYIIIADGKEHIIYATDAATNSTTVMLIKVNEISSLDDTIEHITASNVDSSDRNELQDVLNEVDGLLNSGKSFTEEELAQLNDIKTNTEVILASLTEAENSPALASELTNGAEGSKPETMVVNETESVVNNLVIPHDAENQKPDAAETTAPMLADENTVQEDITVQEDTAVYTQSLDEGGDVEASEIPEADGTNNKTSDTDIVETSEGYDVEEKTGFPWWIVIVVVAVGVVAIVYKKRNTEEV